MGPKCLTVLGQVPTCLAFQVPKCLTIFIKPEKKLLSIEVGPTALASLTLAYDLDLQSPASHSHDLLTCRSSRLTVNRFQIQCKQTDSRTDRRTEAIALSTSLMRSVSTLSVSVCSYYVCFSTSVCLSTCMSSEPTIHTSANLLSMLLTTWL